jgi:hypothetical protein
MVKPEAAGVIAYRDANNFGNAVSVAGEGGKLSEGSPFSRLADRIPFMDATANIHDTWANIFGTQSWQAGLPHLCESPSCWSLMLPAAAVSYGTLSRWMP